MRRDPRTRIGVITKGSLVEGLEMKLDPHRSVEEVKAGKFVVVQGQQHEFFSMITDLRLEATSSQILLQPPSEEETVLREVLRGKNTYATISLRPMLMLRIGEEAFGAEPQPVKTIPSHFAPVYEATEEDVNRVFGGESLAPRYFHIGTPLDMETPVCLNLDRFVERSNGIFGKTGTGKTFLTRLVLSGLIHRKHGEVVTFIFDMHSEYGWEAAQEGSDRFVKGLKWLFGDKVAIFTLDPESARRRNAPYDCEVRIRYEDITVEDIAPLQDELRLNQTAIEAAYLVVAQYGKHWLKALLEASNIKEFAEEVGAHPESLSALQRKLKRLERFPFLTDNPHDDVLTIIRQYIERGTHIVLEFGQQTSLLCYLLVANILARRIHEMYVHQTERYMATQRPEEKPKHLVIVIEEAHKFLNPQAAKQTPFGAIAREMRKYFVSLLVVDQRPSEIDDEVLSQIGTRIIALLNDEKDIQAVLTGVSNTAGLRSVLASLDTKQQALILGHAVPMPIVIRTRDYDHRFYEAMGYTAERAREQTRRMVEELFSS